MTKKIIVVGAGIGGLAAAYRLMLSGFEVEVIEASERVGGRMTTDRREGYAIDRGAQFLSSGYAMMRRLAGELGMAGQWRVVAKRTGIVRAGKVRRVSQRHPWSVATSGLLSWRTAARLALQGMKIARRARGIALSDYSSWAHLDSADAARWFDETVGAEALEYLLEPMLEGFYFQAPEATSAAWASVLWEFGGRRAVVGVLEAGMGSLPESLARRVPVRLATPAVRIEAAGSRLEVHTRNGLLEADHVVLAAPASTARTLWSSWSDIERRLLRTPYSSTINIGLATRGSICTDLVARDIYGVLIPRRERKAVAAVGIESRKFPSYVPRGELLNVMLDGQTGSRLLDAEEDRVLAEVFPELNRYFPGIDDQVQFAHFCRWREAEPCSPVGRSRDLAQYRAQVAARLPAVLLAGDYMSIPTTEGAVESGMWIAQRLSASVR